ncbi:hypothetical protein GCM10027294_38180 [Marinactinospora endophytica]
MDDETAETRGTDSEGWRSGTTGPPPRRRGVTPRRLSGYFVVPSQAMVKGPKLQVLAQA